MSDGHEHWASEIFVRDSTAPTGYLHDALTNLNSKIASLQGELSNALERIAALEKQTPSAIRAQRELDETLADNAAAGYGPDDWRHDPAYRED